MSNTHGEFIQGDGWSAFIDGVPDECNHVWDGPSRIEFHDGAVMMESDLPSDPEELKKFMQGRSISCGYVTCSKCGKGYEPDLWLV